jgi:hypothetical protein
VYLSDNRRDKAVRLSLPVTLMLVKLAKFEGLMARFLVSTLKIEPMKSRGRPQIPTIRSMQKETKTSMNGMETDMKCLIFWKFMTAEEIVETWGEGLKLEELEIITDKEMKVSTVV